MHSNFGDGELTHIFWSSEKVSIAVKFHGIGVKIIDQRVELIKPLRA